MFANQLVIKNLNLKSRKSMLAWATDEMSDNGDINGHTLFERHEKTGFFSYAKTKPQISFAATAKLISAFVFAT